MSEIRELVLALIERGVDPADAAEIITRAALAGASSNKDTTAEKRRAYDRERKRKEREVHPTPVESGGQTLPLPSPPSPTPPSTLTISNQPPIVPQKSGRKGRQSPEEYPPEFEAAWRAYPHVTGRSSKPKALAEWRKLNDETAAGLEAGIQRFRPNVAKVCGEPGAPCMARWLRDGKHLDWLARATPQAQAPGWAGPAEVRDAVRSLNDGERMLAFLAQCSWQEVPRRAVIGSNSFVIDRLRREAGGALSAIGVDVLHRSAA